jgi:hypothetical protein
MEVMVNTVVLSTDRAWTRFEIEPGPSPHQKLTIVIQAGEGNRTLVSSLGSWRSTIELHPQTRAFRFNSDYRLATDRIIAKIEHRLTPSYFPSPFFLCTPSFP